MQSQLTLKIMQFVVYTSCSGSDATNISLVRAGATGTNGATIAPRDQAAETEVTAHEEERCRPEVTFLNANVGNTLNPHLHVDLTLSPLGGRGTWRLFGAPYPS